MLQPSLVADAASSGFGWEHGAHIFTAYSALMIRVAQNNTD